jgi:hypothetical protein
MRARIVRMSDMSANENAIRVSICHQIPRASTRKKKIEEKRNQKKRVKRKTANIPSEALIFLRELSV